MGSKTIVVQIGNTDDKLTQVQWHNFASDLYKMMEAYSSDIHFFGFSPADAAWQNCCIVATIDEVYVRAYLEWDSLDEYVDNLRHKLRFMARGYFQDSIALMVGETEFVGYGKGADREHV